METGPPFVTNDAECVADVIVIGGGPGGCAAAIWCALHHLRVTLLEGQVFPRYRPGETLHPGIEPILRQLGVHREVIKATALRHEGHHVHWNGHDHYVSFGRDGRGTWKGYQLLREDLDQILLQRAKQVGVSVHQPCFGRAPLLSGRRVTGVQTTNGELRAKFVIDASGASRCLERHLGLVAVRYSPPLYAYYGYCKGTVAEQSSVPRFVANCDGWTWTARIDRNLYHWTKLSFSPELRSRKRPSCFDRLHSTGKTGGADVTWRLHPKSAGSGYFLVGDAAAVLDPAASHGVLRAMMSGIMAGHATVRIIEGSLSECRTIAAYRQWLSTWFHHDVARMRRLYSCLHSARFTGLRITTRSTD